MNEIKEHQKKLNTEKAIKTRLINRKIHKFNNFNNEDNKRNKAERKLYSMLNEEQKKNFKIRIELLDLDIDFFKEIYSLGFGVSLFGVAEDWKISSNSINRISIEDIEKLINPINEEIKEYNFIVSTKEELEEIKNQMSGKIGDWTATPNIENGTFEYTFSEKTTPQEVKGFEHLINEDFNNKTKEEKINIVMDLVAQGAEIENNILIPPPPLSLKKPSNKKKIKF